VQWDTTPFPRLPALQRFTSASLPSSLRFGGSHAQPGVTYAGHAGLALVSESADAAAVVLKGPCQTARPMLSINPVSSVPGAPPGARRGRRSPSSGGERQKHPRQQPTARRGKRLAGHDPPEGDIKRQRAATGTAAAGAVTAEAAAAMAAARTAEAAATARRAERRQTARARRQPADSG
jgi:hypothetical protein